jgi:hypothetical protein
MLPNGLQKPLMRAPITYEKVLAVEGHDAFQFFKALLRQLSLLTEIEIRNFGGVDDLSDFLNLLIITPGFERVTSLGIIRDAETNTESAFQSVRDSLAMAALSVPEHPMLIADGKPKVSIFILPDCENPGMLETLCLQAVSDDMEMVCVKEYFDCTKNQGLTLPSNMPKAQVQAFLASKPRSGLLLGQAAHEGYWPWDHPALTKIKQFLSDI